MRERLIAAWEALWFAPAPARTLAGARIVIALHALWIVGSREFGALGALPAPFWAATPISTRLRYGLWLGSPAGLSELTVVGLVVALAFVVAGWRTRASALAAALLLYHVAPLETVLWTNSAYERGFEVSILALVVLAASRAGDAWVVGGGPPPPDAAAYRWPLVLIRLFVAQIYLFSGWSKLARVGWQWVSADNLARWLTEFAEQDQVRVFTRLGPWIAEHPALCLAAAVLALTLDLSFIATVVSRRARQLLIPAAVMMHVGILFAMNIAFLNLPQLLVFTDWDRLARGRTRQSNATS